MGDSSSPTNPDELVAASEVLATADYDAGDGEDDTFFAELYKAPILQLLANNKYAAD